MDIDGGCLCGHITYQAQIDPQTVAVCHCTDCQTLSGSAFRTFVPVLEGSFKLTGAAPRTYTKTAENGTRRVLAFCPECGTHIYSAPEQPGQGYTGLRSATARQRDRLPPKAQYWCQSAQPWAMNLAALEQVAKE